MTTNKFTIQIIIAENVRMRNTPKLLFVSDNSIEQGFDITRQIEEFKV